MTRALPPDLQLDGFIKAAQKGGKGLGNIFRRKPSAKSPGSPGSFGLEDLLLFSNVSTRILQHVASAQLSERQFKGAHSGAGPSLHGRCTW